jgi:DGQHR domain-containing protein
MKIKALEFEQQGKKLYVATMWARDLLDENKVKIDRWRRSDPQGYQREPTPSRCKAFARYVTKTKGISPPSVLLSVRKKVHFDPEDDSFGTLTIPEPAELWIVDGQHRIDGLRIASEDDPTVQNFQIAVVILPLDPSEIDPKLGPRYEEAKQFVIINRTQKGVRSDLAERFLTELSRREGIDVIKDLPSQVTRGIEWKPKAIKITDILNQRPDSPWQERIRLPNEPRASTIISQKSFTDSLEPIITHRNFADYKEDEIAEMLVRYWAAIRELCPEAFDNPTEHVLQKTTGVFVLHELFPSVASYCIDEKGRAKLTKEKIKDVLGKMDIGMQSEYWHSNGEAGLAGTSKKAFDLLLGRLRDSLERGNERRAVPTRPFEL